MLVKNEADIIGPVVEHTLANVDQIIVADGGSTDGTVEILAEFPVLLQLDNEVAHYQGRKTTALAMQALELGHTWGVPIDADEVWISGDGRSVRDFLAGVPPNVKTVRAVLYNHFPTVLDETMRWTESGWIVDRPPEPNPLKRIGYRSRSHQPSQFGKVACRLLPGLVINEGNHSAWSPEIGTEIGGLEVRHFSWRTAKQYAGKIANGYRALAATDFAPDIGAQWRMHGDPDEPGFDERVMAHFSQYFWSDDPEADDLVYDPAPLATNVDVSDSVSA
jgi:hypothetical protein